MRRVAGGQIILVRAGFVQDTQLPLFSPIHCAAPVCSAGPTTAGLLSWAGFTSPCQNIGCPLPSPLPRPPNECFQQRCTTISQLPRGTIALTAPKRYNSVSTTQESACRQRVFELKLGKKVFRARGNLRGRNLRSPLSRLSTNDSLSPLFQLSKQIATLQPAVSWIYRTKRGTSIL